MIHIKKAMEKAKREHAIGDFEVPEVPKRHPGFSPGSMPDSTGGAPPRTATDPAAHAGSPSQRAGGDRLEEVPWVFEPIEEPTVVAEKERAAQEPGPADVSAAPAVPSRVEPMDGRPRGPEYSQTRTIPVDRKSLVNKRVFSILDKDQVADQYKLLRTMLLNKTRPRGLNAVEIVSFKDNEGKTLTAVNLAITLARESRQTVLLVDADLRQPRVHDVLGLPSKPGLRDYFVENTPLKDILVHPEIEALSVLPAGGRMNNSTEVLGSFRMEELVREIKSRYEDRYIIFDTPALVFCPDALVLSTYVDGIVLVARANHTTTEDAVKCVKMLEDRNVLGVVLNDGQVRREWAY